jgi:hypothetical protein
MPEELVHESGAGRETSLALRPPSSTTSNPGARACSAVTARGFPFLHLRWARILVPTCLRHVPDFRRARVLRLTCPRHPSTSSRPPECLAGSAPRSPWDTLTLPTSTLRLAFYGQARPVLALTTLTLIVSRFGAAAVVSAWCPNHHQ